VYYSPLPPPSGGKVNLNKAAASTNRTVTAHRAAANEKVFQWCHTYTCFLLFAEWWQCVPWISHLIG
jgi:hypothetical protein